MRLVLGLNSKPRPQLRRILRGNQLHFLGAIFVEISSLLEKISGKIGVCASNMFFVKWSLYPVIKQLFPFFSLGYICFLDNDSICGCPNKQDFKFKIGLNK